MQTLPVQQYCAIDPHCRQMPVWHTSPEPQADPEVQQGIVPRSQHLPMHLIPLKLQDLPRDKDVVLYCRSGARSFHACAFLMQQGVRNVINLRGGILDWARCGFEIAAPQGDRF